jgi:hypothetical protein
MPNLTCPALTLLAALTSTTAQAVILHPGSDPVGDGVVPEGLAVPVTDVLGWYNDDASAVAISPRHALTTSHQGVAIGHPVGFAGATYRVAASEQLASDVVVLTLETLDGQPAALAHWAEILDPEHDITPGASVVMGGYGKQRGSDLIAPNDVVYGYNWAGPDNKSPLWGENRIQGVGAYTDTDGNPIKLYDIMVALFDGPTSANAAPHEAALGDWDSGGGWFFAIDDAWYLGGLTFSVQRRGESRFLEADGVGEEPDFLAAAYLPQFRNQILAVIPEPASLALLATGLAAVLARRRNA